MKKTTLCYIFCQDEILMIHRTKKKNDVNEGKYIGLGGHFLANEQPLDCVLREVYEESGIRLKEPSYRGVVTFLSNVYPAEEMHLFTAVLDQKPPLPACEEGELCYVTAEKLFSLNLWQGDRIFLSLLLQGAPYFELTLSYEGESLKSATLNGNPLTSFSDYSADFMTI